MRRGLPTVLKGTILRSRAGMPAQPALGQRSCFSPTSLVRDASDVGVMEGAQVPGRVHVQATSADGKTVSFAAPSGMTLMQAMRDVAKLDIEAACDGTCSCSTCHVVLREEDYRKLSPPSEDEVDMLDLAPTVTPTSRLACQVVLSEKLDGITVQIPSEV
ncbi:putative adrenodoxin precursor [Trypanosoma vivax]|uniref:Putative adrenodoxin n=1 Tax=Trypanosoma vivax (strain Y486) TaxID=1055687 RepID=G0TUX8_TRYVY|nr:putative adrenodoxin precursor [Trypanosoma vivax]CCC47765.1 putative adrenodoxin precursor [Trypanosoma vivax Y486]